MRVLMVERESGVDEVTAAAVRSSEHEVVQCDPSDHAAGPCVGMPGEVGCPLDRWPVDVVLSMRGEGGPTTEMETGVRCAIRQHIPVMVIGNPAGASYAEWVSDVVEAGDPDLEQRIDDLGRSAMAPANEAVGEAVGEVLARHGLGDLDFSVSVTHTDSRLRVAAHTSEPLDPHIAHAAAVRAVAAVRDIQPWYDRIDVDVSGPDGTIQRITP